ncbi:MAG: 5'-nucleotidase, lipoprotein e(P4) family [Bacteroidota bacterium]
MRISPAKASQSFTAFVLVLVLVFPRCTTKWERGDNGRSGLSRNEHMVMAVLWFQTSAEARALYYQAFNTARHMLDHELETNKSLRKKAVVIDIDDTVLDNSPYEAKLIADDVHYPEGWQEWVDSAVAQSLPGALEFLTYAVSRGVHVLYVSNRKASEKAATVKNLQTEGFPQLDDAHLFLTAEASSKENRRKTIAADYDIALLVGDNLNDFSDVFEGKSMTDRANAVDSLKEYFGKRFIVLPNPMYGKWEGAVYGYDWSLPDAMKDSRRKGAMRTF